MICLQVVISLPSARESGHSGKAHGLAEVSLRPTAVAKAVDSTEGSQFQSGAEEQGLHDQVVEGGARFMRVSVVAKRKARTYISQCLSLCPIAIPAEAGPRSVVPAGTRQRARAQLRDSAGEV